MKKTTMIMMVLLTLAGCESTSGNGEDFQSTLHKKMTFSYCYQYMYGSYSSAINYSKAFQWCGKSIMDANPRAMTLMAEIYFFGLDQEVNLGQALYWYQQGAKLGQNHAQYMLAHIYHLGLGHEPSLELAHEWNSKALANNHPRAKQQLAKLQPLPTSEPYLNLDAQY